MLKIRAGCCPECGTELLMGDNSIRQGGQPHGRAFCEKCKALVFEQKAVVAQTIGNKTYHASDYKALYNEVVEMLKAIADHKPTQWREMDGSLNDCYECVQKSKMARTAIEKGQKDE